MKTILRYIPLVGLLFLLQCKTSKTSTSGVITGGETQAVITQQGLLSGFEQGLSANGQPIWCEASAIVYDGNKLFVANDKDMPDKRSSVFYWNFKNVLQIPPSRRSI